VHLVEKGFAAAQTNGSELQIISASRARAWNYLLDGKFQQAHETMDWIVHELERLGLEDPPSDLYVSARWMSDSFRYFLDGLGETARTATETHEMAVRANNRTIQSSSAILLSHIYFVMGDYPFAKDWADRALKIAQGIATDASIHRAAALAFAARVQLGERGNVSRFIDLAEHGLTLGGNLLYSIGIVVEALLDLGDLNRAELFAQRAHEHSAGRLREMLTLVPLADVRWRLGPAHWQAAQQHYDRAIALAEAMQSQSALAVALIGAGELAESRGDRKTSHTHGRRALDICRGLGMAHYLPRAERLVVAESAEAVSA
jgi:tetratricopeptide (TPR) repeat protein